MRTTLTLEQDVAARLRSEMRRSGKGMKAIVNGALRAGLGLSGKPLRAPRFHVRPHAFRFHEGIDLDRMNQLVDELQTEQEARSLRK